MELVSEERFEDLATTGSLDSTSFWSSLNFQSFCFCKSVVCPLGITDFRARFLESEPNNFIRTQGVSNPSFKKKNEKETYHYQSLVSWVLVPDKLEPLEPPVVEFPPADTVRCSLTHLLTNIIGYLTKKNLTDGFLHC